MQGIPLKAPIGNVKVVRGPVLSIKQCWCKLNINSCTYSGGGGGGL